MSCGNGRVLAGGAADDAEDGDWGAGAVAFEGKGGDAAGAAAAGASGRRSFGGKKSAAVKPSSKKRSRHRESDDDDDDDDAFENGGGGDEEAGARSLFTPHHHVHIVYWYTKHPGPIVYSCTCSYFIDSRLSRGKYVMFTGGER